MLESLIPASFGILGVSVAGYINYRIAKENRIDKEIDFFRKRLEEIYTLSLEIHKINEQDLTMLKSPETCNPYRQKIFEDIREKKIRIYESRLVMLIEFYLQESETLSDNIEKVSFDNMILRCQILQSSNSDNKEDNLDKFHDNHIRLYQYLKELQDDIKKQFRRKLKGMYNCSRTNPQ